MRVLVSDYAGHPFQVQLSRALAARGHEVLHVSSDSAHTPKGKLGADAADPATFRSVGVRTARPFAKHSFLKRRRQEIELGRLIAGHVAAFRPDVVLSANAPLDTQRHIQATARDAGAKFVFWVQDLYGEAVLRILREKLGFIGAAIGGHYRRMERAMLRASDHSVVISSDFKAFVLREAGLPADTVTVIENWAPLDELEPDARNNGWAKANLPKSRFRAIYSGTLGYKHNPQLLAKLARALDGDVIVFSEGPAAEELKRQAERERIANLHVSGWLPFADLPKALAGADLLLVILEPDAGIFSVPSKVLTYMCAGRPILAAMPHENLAARIVRGSGAGVVVGPAEDEAFVSAACAMARDREGRAFQGRAARAYAEKTFDIGAIATKFERIFQTLLV